MAAPHGNGSIAKITRPRISGVFPRTRLFGLLDEHLEYPAVWISASAGSGKTTLAASYLAERKLPSIWYQTDESDADIATFFYYMGRAAAKTATGRRPLPLFSAEYLKGVSAFTTRYFERLYNQIKPPFVIVFDNYQLVPADSMLHQVIQAGISMLPEGVNIMIISRQGPPAQFARLRANGVLGAMAADEVLLTLDESLSIMAMKGLKGLPEGAVNSLYEKTGGWAAGLVLLLERVRVKGADAIGAADVAAEDIFDYFAYEAFEKTDPDTREFLLKTSFLPRMTVNMARDLAGEARSGDILSDLYRNHFFIQKDVLPQPFYQYHPLFREFLQARAMGLMTPEQILTIRREAAGILEQTGQIEDAVGMLMAAEAWEDLTPLLLSHAPSIVRQGRSATLEAWLKAFPHEFLDHSPKHLYWMGLCLMSKSPREGLACFEKAFHIYNEQQDLSGMLLTWSGAVSSLVLTWDDYKLLDPWIEWLDSRIGQGLVFPSREIEAHVASGMAGALVWRFPNRRDVEDWLDRASRLSRELKDGGLTSQNQFHRTNFYYFLGDFVGMAAVIQGTDRSASWNGAPPPHLLSLKAAQAISMTLAASGDALRLLGECLELSDRSGIFLFKDILFTMGFFAALNAGDIAVADEYLYLKARGLEDGPRDNIGRYYMCYAWRRLLDGDYIYARSVAEQGLNIAEEGGGVNSRQMMHHLVSVILQGQRYYDEALRHITEARGLIPRSDEGYYYAYIYLLTEADIRLDMGMRDKGLDCLRDAMAIGRRRGYRSLFLFWRPAVMTRLCAVALEQGIEVEYVKELITGLGLSSEGAPVHVEEWPWPVRIYTLGEFRLFLNNEPVHFPRKAPRKPLQLLMTIIALGGKNVKDDRLKDMLWQEAEDDNAHSSLTSALARLRTILGSEKAVLVNNGMLTLNPRHCWVDVWAFERIADLAETGDRSGEETDDEAYLLLEKAVNMYGGSFLSGEEDGPWITPLRERLLKRYCALISEICNRLEREGRNDEAARYCLRALDVDDIIDEAPYQRLMKYYCCKDQPGRAVEVYMRLKRILSSRLGARPSLAVENIYKRLVK